MRKIPTKKGFQRLDEGVASRDFRPKEASPQNGKFCLGCNKYYSYLKPLEKLCVSCNSRYNSLNKR